MSTNDETPTDLYARCLTCGIDLATPEVETAHRHATIPADGSPSHTTTTLNPTAEDRAKWRVLSAFDDAIMKLAEDLDESIVRGDFTAADVRAASPDFPDFEDAWAEYEAGR